ncbi:MAG TPA: DNA repair exonuclease [Pirellulales bacterium]|nr:DNA repair exonuclease [Pirellulales bacterium]
MFKFLHAADIHLDSPLRGLERYEGAPVDEIRGATRRALENLVQLAIDREVNFVVIAGDLYDGDWRDHHTGLFFVAEMLKLRDAGVPVYLISGNHDAANRMTKTLRLPEDTVHRFAAKKPHTLHVEACGVSIHGQSFATGAVTENLACAYPPAVPGNFNLGLLHTCATGDDGHECYAPCSIDDLRGKRYDYWALGHVHQRRRLADEEHIHFSGNVQGRHIRESGPKGCLLVTVDDARQTSIEFEPLDVLRWERCLVDADQCESGYDVVDRVSESLGRLLAASEGRLLAVRVEVVGACPAHEKLAAEPQRWITEVRSLARDVGQGGVWVEKVRFQTSPPPAIHGAAIEDGPLGELFQCIAELRDDPVAATRLTAELADLWRKLPAEFKEGEDSLRLDDAAGLRRLLDQVQPLLVARLMHGAGL